MKRTLTALAVLIALVLAGCGGGHHSSSTSRTTGPPPVTAAKLSAPTPHACKPGEGHLGCAVQHQFGANFHAVKLPNNQGLIPDVYEGDSVYSWAQAKPHIRGAIVKVWEYRQDHQFRSNWTQLANLGVWHAAYVFMHGDCGQVNNAVAAMGGRAAFQAPNTGPLILDIETPDAGGVSNCAVPRARSLTGRVPIVYTSPGVWPGGNPSGAYEWAAGYGNYTHSPCIWTCQSVAWQYTDGQYGPYPHQISGIQPGDISVSYGMQNLVPTVVKCFGAHPANTAQCKATRANVQRWSRAIVATRRALTQKGCWRYTNHARAPQPCATWFQRGDWFHRQIVIAQRS